MAALAAAGCNGSNSRTGETGGAGTGGTSELASPAMLGVVSVPDIDPAWPIGRSWSPGVGGSHIHLACPGADDQADYPYNPTVAAGAGASYVAKADSSAFPFPMCQWEGPASADHLSIVGAPTTCPYTSLTGPAMVKLDSIALRLVAEDGIEQHTHRVFGHGTASGPSGACVFDFEDYMLTTFLDAKKSVVIGHHDETLPAPVALKGWGEFDVTDVSRTEVIDMATYRHVLDVEADGAPSAGLALAPHAYALKSGDLSIYGFEVLVGVTNQGDTPLCLTSGKITAVVNAGGLPVDPNLGLDEIDGPLVGSQTCLRPAERAWIFVYVNTLDSGAFGNAARARLGAGQPLGHAGLGGHDAPAGPAARRGRHADRLRGEPPAPRW